MSSLSDNFEKIIIESHGQTKNWNQFVQLASKCCESITISKQVELLENIKLICGATNMSPHAMSYLNLKIKELKDQNSKS